MATTQYVIDIAASMPAGEKTIAQLDELTRQLLAGGVGADALHDAVATASNALASARDATVSANAALAEGNAEFARLERAALQAAKAQEKAAQLGVVPPDVAASLSAATADLDAHTTKLRELERAAAGAKANEAQLATTLQNVKQAATAGNAALAEQKRVATEAARTAAEEARKAADKQAKAAADAARAHDALTQKSVREAEGMVPLVKNWNDLGDALSTSQGQMILATGAAVGVAAAIAAVTVALVAATIAVAAWAVGLADSARNVQLSAEAMEAMHPELIGLRGAIAAVSDETGAHTDELQEWAGQLRAAKVSAADMPAALRAIALSEAALGSGGASEFLAEIKEGKRAVGDLAAEANSKLGPIVAKQMMGLSAQSARLKKNVGEIFGGLNIEPVLGGLKTLVELFDKNTAAGQAIKLLFESVFQPLIDQAQNAAYVIEAFVLGFLIGLTKLYIAVKPAIKAVSEFLGFKDTSLTDTLDVAKIAGELIAPVFVGIVGIFGLLAAAVGLAIAPFVLLSAAFYALVGAAVAVGAAILGGFMSAWQAVKDFFAGLDLAQVGSDIMTGLANGITNAAGAVVNAITGAVGGAIDAAKNLLGIKSPSKVFAEIGGDTGAGLTEGVEDATPDVQSAFTAMVEPPDVPASPLDAQDTPWGASAPIGGAPVAQAADAGPSAEAAGKSGGGGSILEGATLNFYGVKDAETARDLFEEMLTRVLEGDAAQIAGEAAPA